MRRPRYDAEGCRWRIRSCHEDITNHLVSAVRYGHEMTGPIREVIEGIEIYSINLDQVTGAGETSTTRTGWTGSTVHHADATRTDVD